MEKRVLLENILPFSLDTVGKEVVLYGLRGKPITQVLMVVKAPRGICTIFSGRNQSANWYWWEDKVEECKSKAIKAFMEEHKND